MQTQLKLFFVFTFILFSYSSFSKDFAGIVVENMQCEYLTNPKGLDVKKPRFYWTLRATDVNKYGQRQTAYRIVVSDSKSLLSGSLWDSGWVESDQTRHIEYNGKNLLSDKTYYWKVKVKDENGFESDWSPVAEWSSGLFDQSEWTAKWIGSDVVFDPSQPVCNVEDPWFRKTVELKRKPTRAYMYVASVGYHELYVNGKKVGDEVLAPVVSDHTTRARYVAYDIADYLTQGNNTIGLWLGTSWSIFPPYATEDKPATPIVIAQADIYNDKIKFIGSKPVMRIQTDETWKTHPSPNKLTGKWDMHAMSGEVWDANNEIPDWSSNTLDDSRWKNATVYTPKLKLSAQNTEGTVVLNEINPVSIEELPNGDYRVDMGVNFAGWTNIKVTGNPGDQIQFLFSEREQDEMTFGMRSAYIVGPSGKGEFKNKFNYSSGRWITIKGLKNKPQNSDIKGWLVRSGYKPAATFETSDDLQNWIYDRVRWTFENLSIGGYIVDCPQRERLGYGGDAHATSETGMFNYKMGAFYTKWMQDWRDMQGWESNNGKRVGGGVLPHTAPTNNGGGGPSWGGICITLPWFVYLQEGDTRILEENFDMMSKWIGFLNTHVEDNILRRYGGNWDFLADWLWPNATAEGMNNDKIEAVCFNSCYMVFNLATAAKIGRLIGRDAEAQMYEKQADAMRKAIHDKFYDPVDNSYCDKSMCNLTVALLADVPPTELRDQVMKRLEDEILVVRNGHIHVGITGGAMLFKLLRDLGRDDLIYSMTSQTDYPSWGYMRASDATTIWEMWEKDLPGHSLLHSSYLYPGAWYIDGLAGIKRDPENPGFKKFIIRAPELKTNNVTWTIASYDSPVGKIETAWRKENGLLSQQVTVPANSTATLWFPQNKGKEIIENSGKARVIGSQDGYILYELIPGKYTFSEK